MTVTVWWKILFVLEVCLDTTIPERENTTSNVTLQYDKKCNVVSYVLKTHRLGHTPQLSRTMN